MESGESDDLFRYLLSLEKLTSMHETTTPTHGRYRHEHGKLMFIRHDLYEAGAFPENIWGNTMKWPPEMMAIKERVEQFTGHQFDVCVCVYYPDGNSGVDYHSDYPAFGDTSYIASVSVGEEREFCLREKESFKVHKLSLQQGSLLIMGDQCQERYEHSLPHNPVYKTPRVNMTFRKYGRVGQSSQP